MAVEAHVTNVAPIWCSWLGRNEVATQANLVGLIKQVVEKRFSEATLRLDSCF